MGFSDWYCLDYRVIRRMTEKAIEVITADNKIYWIPLSQVSPLDKDDLTAGARNGSLSVTERYAREKGWVEDADAA